MIVRFIGVFLGVIFTWALMVSGIFGGVGPTHEIETTVTEPLTALCSITQVTLVPGQAIPITCTLTNPTTEDVTVRLQTVAVPPAPGIVLLSDIDTYVFELLAGVSHVTEYRYIAGPDVPEGTYMVAVNVIILDATP